MPCCNCLCYCVGHPNKVFPGPAITHAYWRRLFCVLAFPFLHPIHSMLQMSVLLCRAFQPGLSWWTGGRPSARSLDSCHPSHKGRGAPSQWPLPALLQPSRYAAKAITALVWRLCFSPQGMLPRLSLHSFCVFASALKVCCQGYHCSHSVSATNNAAHMSVCEVMLHSLVSGAEKQPYG